MRRPLLSPAPPRSPRPPRRALLRAPFSPRRSRRTPRDCLCSSTLSAVNPTCSRFTHRCRRDAPRPAAPRTHRAEEVRRGFDNALNTKKSSMPPRRTPGDDQERWRPHVFEQGPKRGRRKIRRGAWRAGAILFARMPSTLDLSDPGDRRRCGDRSSRRPLRALRALRGEPFPACLSHRGDRGERRETARPGPHSPPWRPLAPDSCSVAADRRFRWRPSGHTGRKRCAGDLPTY
jgi:hypothetical protein